MKNNVKLTHLIKENEYGYKYVIDNYHLNEIQFSSEEDGGIGCTITQNDSSMKQKCMC